MHLEGWLLDPAITHLNHGAFGAVPAVVLAEQERWRRLYQQDPTSFVVGRWEPALDEARRQLGKLVGAEPGDMALVPNTTTGVNAVLRSLPFAPGDQILTTDHVYNACRNVLNQVAATTGAEVVLAPVPFPLESADQVVEAVMSRATGATRLALLDHVTSATGLVLPVERLIPALEQMGVAVMVDGAHAPGMVPLEVAGLGASYYAGNCHKWLCAPPGAAFLWVRPGLAPGILPPVISHGANDPRSDRPRLHRLFDYTGTLDPSSYLAVPAAIEFLSGLHPDGLSGVMATNRALALEARSLLCEVVGTPPPAPPDMIGSLAAITLPDGRGDGSAGFVDPLTRLLLEKWKIQVPIFVWPAWPQRNLRLSAAPYNDLDDYQRLGEALKVELAAAA
jgi:isopenicillin-N epimerase